MEVLDDRVFAGRDRSAPAADEAMAAGPVIACIESVKASIFPLIRLSVIDNACADGSEVRLRSGTMVLATLAIVPSPVGR